MVKWRLREGQSLVELIVILPAVCLALVVTIQIIASCHNAVLLQRMAFKRAREISAAMSPVPLAFPQNPLWGRGAIPTARQSTSIPTPWRPFKTVLTPRVTEPGHITSVTVSSLLLPTKGFGQGLSILNQQAMAEAYLEPPVPRDE